MLLYLQTILPILITKQRNYTPIFCQNRNFILKIFFIKYTRGLDKPRYMKKSLYDVLDVKFDSSLNEIKKKYYELVKSLHPDKLKSPTEEDKRRFQEIVEAYSILSNESQRFDYDNMLKSEIEAYERNNSINEKRSKMIDDIKRKESTDKHTEYDLRSYQNDMKRHLESFVVNDGRLSFQEYENIIINTLEGTS